jgi:phosphoribosylpyrophosphate synthetase
VLSFVSPNAQCPPTSLTSVVVKRKELPVMKDELRIFAGNSNRALAEEICHHLGLPINELEVVRFANDNLFVQVLENVRERDVFVVQSFTHPVSEHIMELMITLDALRSASAKRITAVIPYYSYARSDKKDAPRISITGRLMADLLHTAGANRVIAGATHPILCGPAVYNLQMAELEELIVTNTCHVSPDKCFDKLTILSVAPLLAEAIRRIHSGESVGALFN